MEREKRLHEDPLASEKQVGIVLGTMTFATKQIDESTAEQVIDLYTRREGDIQTKKGRDPGAIVQIEIDTAFLYEYCKTEVLLGSIYLQKKVDTTVRWSIATKANPFPNSGKSLKPESIKMQMQTSFKNLGVDRVDIFYLHAPDYKNPIEASLQACQELYQEGKFSELGLSNYSAWQVVDIYHICKSKGWVLPTVYQGMYNPIVRGAEPELFPALRKYGIRFYAYNPLAGGLLTGKYSFDTKPTKGRFVDRKHYMDRYWKDSSFQAVEVVKEACALPDDGATSPSEISLTDATFRWMMHHSQLKAEYGDKIIIGGSSLAQFEQNFNHCYGSVPLPKRVVDAFTAAWDIAKPDAPSYFKTQ